MPAIHALGIGDIRVTALHDGHVELPFAVLRPVDAAAASAIIPPPPARGRVTIHAFLVQAAGRTALIDAGAGSTLGPDAGLLLRSLALAGVTPAEIQTVLLTHLHSDHANGLLDDEGRPVFPQAEILVQEDEAAHWCDDARLARAAAAVQPAFATARRVLAGCAPQLRTFRSGEVLPGIEAVRLPGHTPGHTGFRIASGNEALLVWGDIVHMPDIQVAHPGIGIVFDVDRAAAAATRRRVLDMAAAEGLRIAGMHLEAPGVARIGRNGTAFALVADA